MADGCDASRSVRPASLDHFHVDEALVDVDSGVSMASADVCCSIGLVPRTPLGALPAKPPAKRLWRPNSTADTAVFVVGDRFVSCLLCGKSAIGLNVRQHARGDAHQQKLSELAPEAAAAGFPNAVSLAEAEICLALRTETKSSRKRRRRMEKETAQQEAAAGSASLQQAELSPEPFKHRARHCQKTWASGS